MKLQIFFAKNKIFMTKKKFVEICTTNALSFPWEILNNDDFGEYL